LNRLKDQYEIIYYNITKRRMEQQFDEVLIEKIKYFIMRLQFIHPIYLPSLSEQYLRKDFDFARYLRLAQGKTLKAFFNTSWLSLLLLLLIIDASKLVVHDAERDTDFDYRRLHSYTHILVCLAPPLVFFMVLNGYRRYSQQIESMLYP
jgi:hypothetical protein